MINEPAKVIPIESAADKTAENLGDLCRAQQLIKNNQKVLAQRLREVEDGILAIIGHNEEGAFSVVVGDKYKVTTTGKINRTVDTAGVQDAWPDLRPVVRESFVFKASLDIKQMRALEKANPDAYKEAASFITAKPGKASVDVKLIEPAE